MANVGQVKEALAIITADSDQTIAVIDAEIESLEKEIAQLRRARRLLAAQPRPGRAAQADRSKQIDVYAACEKLICEAVKKSGPMTCSDLSTLVGQPVVVIGKTVARSERLEKQGSKVVLL